MTDVKTEMQWWGPLDGTLHLFVGMAVGGAPIRTSAAAACGWWPNVPLMEMPEEVDEARKCKGCALTSSPQ